MFSSGFCSIELLFFMNRAVFVPPLPNPALSWISNCFKVQNNQHDIQYVELLGIFEIFNFCIFFYLKREK